uniref:Leucine-rich repeat protein SHOC-2 n=1 Tax=Branchiostoma floridae TaxID=7739 RepID=C3XQ16_BRAFL|eukprot:XP_002614028.1 hypothetical protein BRAFLDRAFT_67388 [Branchiostoma floridae]
MGIDLSTYRARIGCFSNPGHDSLHCWAEASCLLVWMVISQLMLKLAGDVEENPGPQERYLGKTMGTQPMRDEMKREEWKILGKAQPLWTLDLSNQNHKDLPDEVFELEELEALKLTYNESISLSNKLVKLTNLKVLCLENCNLDKLPPVVLKLSHLQVLDISKNKAISLPKMILKKLKKLKVLKLRDCDLVTIGRQIFQQESQLEELDLSGNMQIDLPDELRTLKNIRVLRLNRAGMTTVPPAVLELSQLEKLDLSGNKQIKLSDQLLGLTNLKVLRLSRTEMASVPEVVWKLTHLEELHLLSNPLQTLSVKVGQLSRIKRLDLSNCHLRTLPPEVGTLTQLERLKVANNRALQTLPGELWQVTNIKRLDLSNCQLHTLPPEVGTLTQLEWLDLSFNTLQTLPRELGHVTNIKRLDLSHCQLHTLPPQVGKLTHLKWLKVKNNPLQTLPGELGQVASIKHLDLSNCWLHTLPPEVGTLTQLERLKVANNPLQTLPGELWKVTNIKRLDLSSCWLDTLPPEVGTLTQLEWLSLQGNPLQMLPKQIGQLTAIKHLNLSFCQLHTLPPEMGTLKQLEWLSLQGNPLQMLPKQVENLTHIKWMNLSHCRLQMLPPEFGKLTQLERLYLSCNGELQTLPTRQLTNIKHLDLSNCSLQTLPPEVGELKHVEYLRLSSNPLQKLPPEVRHLTNIKHLDMSNCRLNELPIEVGTMTQLRQLDLRYNQLQMLPVEITQHINLYHLDVRGNPLIRPPAEVCSQGMVAVRQYFEELESGEAVSTHLKVVVLGKELAGKTSLIQTLLSGDSSLTQQEDRTHGVEITQWKPDDNITFEVYDFGGHDAYHLTHQFFLTQDSLHLLTVDLQTYCCTEQDYKNAVGFWLDTLNARVPGAMVTIVCSKSEGSVDIEKKTHDIEVKFKEQQDTWKRNLERQLKIIERAENQEDLKQQFEDIQQLMTRPLQFKGLCCVSSAGPTGLETLTAHVLELAKNTQLFQTHKGILPQTWVDFEQRLRNLRDNEAKWLMPADYQQQAQLAGLPTDKLEPVLSYLQQVGTILRYTDIPELRDFVFHDPPALIEIFKGLFHHNTSDLFSTLDIYFTPLDLDKFKSDLDDRGLILKKVMKHLLPPDTPSNIVTSLMQHYDLCFEIDECKTKASDEETRQYMIPWYLHKTMQEKWQHNWPQHVPEEQLQLMCNIKGFCPRGLFPRFSVGIHSLIKDRVDWKDSVMAYRQDFPVLALCSKPGTDDTYITIATRGRLAQADEMWGVVYPLLEVLVQLLQKWPGVLYSLHVTCAHCIKARLDNPHQYNLRDQTADDDRIVRCPKADFRATVSTDLVYRPLQQNKVFQRYKMKTDPRGLALIISNINFMDPETDRQGGNKDLENIWKICDKLKLKAENKDDLTGQEIADTLQEVSERDHSCYDCFVLFLLSHGDEKGVLGTDEDRMISVDSITSSLQLCKSLVGKPKLFFIQACRGDNFDEGVEYMTTDDIKSPSRVGAEALSESIMATDSASHQSTTPTASDSGNAKRKTIPTASDRLVMNATVQGQVAWRDKNTGSPFIQALADVITEHADTVTLQDMATLVNEKVADYEADADDDYKQQSEVSHSLRKKLYFFPETAVD